MKVPIRSKREKLPGSNMKLLGELGKIKGRFCAEAMEGARRYMRTKLRMDPTTRVEKTKSSSLRPKLGRDAMSPRTQEETPTSSSMRTLKGNWGSAATRDRHPLMKAPMIGRLDGWDLLSSSLLLDSPSLLFPPPPNPFPLLLLLLLGGSEREKEEEAALVRRRKGEGDEGGERRERRRVELEIWWFWEGMGGMEKRE